MLEELLDILFSMLNTPVGWLVGFMEGLLVEPVNVEVFYPLWGVIVHVISMFYGLLFLYVGLNLISSSFDVQKRVRAKMWMRNTLMMIVLVEGSYHLYSIVLKVASLMAKGVMGMVDTSFFMLDIVGVFLLVPYVIVLMMTIMMLLIRYMLVSMGVVLFPIALFMYFVPCLERYGRMMMNVLLSLVFVTFFYGIVLYGASLLAGSFDNVLFAMAALLLVDAVMVLSVFMAVK